MTPFPRGRSTTPYMLDTLVTACKHQLKKTILVQSVERYRIKRNDELTKAREVNAFLTAAIAHPPPCQ